MGHESPEFFISDGLYIKIYDMGCATVEHGFSKIILWQHASRQRPVLIAGISQLHCLLALIWRSSSGVDLCLAIGLGWVYMFIERAKNKS